MNRQNAGTLGAVVGRIGRLCDGIPLLQPMGLTIACLFLVTASCSRQHPMNDSDKEVIDAVQSLKPDYQLDNQGRVIALKLERRQLDATILAEIGKLSELRTLSLYGAALTDDDLAELKDHKRLESLGLGATDITDRGLVHLKELSSLRWLWLPAGDKIAEGKILELQRRLPGLTVYRQK